MLRCLLKKGTLFSSTLKIDGNIVLFFILALNRRDTVMYLLISYHHLLHYCREKNTKGFWSSLIKGFDQWFWSKMKNKGTLISSLLKVKGNKVLFFFSFWAETANISPFTCFFLSPFASILLLKLKTTK